MTEETPGPVAEEEKEPTAKELFEAKIQQLEENQSRYGFNKWRQVAIESLRKELQIGFDADGNEIPIENPSGPPAIQFSPEEAVNWPVDDYWRVFPQGLLDVPPPWISDSGANPEEGLAITVRRSNGCFGIYNLIETAKLWTQNAAAVASKYGCSIRVIQVAGHMMGKGGLFMLPTDDSIMNPYGRAGYAVQPEIPFNEEEKRVWREMFRRYHLNVVAGAKHLVWPLELHPERPQAESRERVDPLGLHGCVTVANNPQLVVPALMAFYNTAAFKQRFYRTALAVCRDVDANRRGRVPGYMRPEEVGGDFSNPFDWYAEYESTDVTKEPKFAPGAIL